LIRKFSSFHQDSLISVRDETCGRMDNLSSICLLRAFFVCVIVIKRLNCAIRADKKKNS